MAYAWNKTMGAPKNYDQWTSFHQQNGDFIANDAQRRDAYRKYAVAHGLPTPWATAPAAGPSTGASSDQSTPPDFNRMDALGTASVANAGTALQQATGIDPVTGLKVGVGALESARDNALADIGIGRINSELGYNDAFRNAQSNAASRGMFNSGMHRFRQARNLTNLQNAMSALDQRQGSTWNAFNRDWAAANSSFTNAQQQALAESALRNMQAWYAARGI